MAGNKRVPAEVQSAMQIARQAEWSVSNRNGKIVIAAPDGVAITVGLEPNDESMKIFRSQARRYNLVTGPAMTPEERKSVLAEAERSGKAEAEQQNAQRKAYEAEQEAKREAIERAKARAEEATKKGMEEPKPAPAKSAPAKAPSPVKGAKAKKAPGFPEFDSSLLGSTDYSKFQLADGGYYCIECLEHGTEWRSRAPQGLATHRGFRHNMYRGGEAVVSEGTVQAIELPEDLQTAFDLLRTVVAEHTGHAADAQRVIELEGRLEKLQGTSAELENLKAELEKVRTESAKVSEEQKVRIHNLTKELSEKDSLRTTEVSSIIKTVERLLTGIREAVNGLSPAQAVGKIDQLLSEFKS